jgi:hypothetical protein
LAIVFSWETVKDEIASVVANPSRDGKAFSPETVAQAEDLASKLSKDWPKPNVGRGYWPTITFSWGKMLEIEIFADHLEVYHFKYDPMKINYFYRSPGEMLSVDLVTALAEVRTQRN